MKKLLVLLMSGLLAASAFGCVQSEYPEQTMQSEESRKEALYANMVSDFEAGNYEKVRDSYSYIEDYSDAAAYINYSTGMCQWNFDKGIGNYRRAIESFEAAGSFMDSADKLNELKNEVKPSFDSYNGTYEYTDKLKIKYFIFIKDGKVGTAIGDVKYDITTPVKYSNEFYRIGTDDAAARTLGLPSGAKINVIGTYRDYTHTADHDYLFMDVSDGSYMVKYVGDVYDSHSGTYKKISDSTPAEKN